MKEVFDCAALLRFQTALEINKTYCRDYLTPGRIRVKLFDDNGKPVREDIPNREFSNASRTFRIQGTNRRYVMKYCLCRRTNSLRESGRADP